MKRRIIRSALFMCLFSVAAITFFCACSKSSGNAYGNGGDNNGGGNNNGTSVSIKNFAFSIATLNVANGATVTWTNNDATAHTVTADDASFDSGNIAPSATFTHKFTAAGTVAYHCSIHTTMKGNVVVAN